MAGGSELIKFHLLGIPLVVLLTTLNAMVLGQSSAEAHKEQLIDKLDNYLTSAQKAYKFSGAALVALNGQVLLEKA